MLKQIAKNFSFSFLIAFIILAFFTLPAEGQTKKADLAGVWYSNSKDALISELRSCLQKATPPKIEGEIIAIISPHAAFAYSGETAAYGFKAIAAQKIDTAVIIGFSHRWYYDYIAVLDLDAVETPLGLVEIDKDITKALIRKNPNIRNYPIAFEEENSVEMEIPFLQATLKDFKIVLIAIGNQSFENAEMLGKVLYETLKDRKNVILIGSTDLSHYLPYSRANTLDRRTISLIEKFNSEKLYLESTIENHQLMCGYGTVCATMLAAQKLGANKVIVLDYKNSGDITKDKRSVVGYLSAAFVKTDKAVKGRILVDANKKTKNVNSKKGDNEMLNGAQKKKILKLARDSITHYLKEGKRLEIKEEEPALQEEMGAFVTLHKHGELRGCIGNLVGKGPFYLTVRDMAIEAATGDPRFRPVKLEEMDDIEIEISALSPLKKIDDPESIEMGKHGVVVRSGFASGVYLPQVATETGWNREQFMSSLCAHKAGIAPDAWKKEECDIYVFTALVFSEKDME